MTMQITVWSDGERINAVSGGMALRSKPEAERFVAAMSKAIRAKATGLSGDPDSTGYVSFYVKFAGDAANKGKNEVGLKRLRMLLATVRWEMVPNEYVTREQFDAFVNGN